MADGMNEKSPPRSGDQHWRVEAATRAALVIDAADYFTHARAAMLQAEHRIMLIGWDFDARIRVGEPGEDGAPDTIGDFVLWLVARRPALQVYLLRWDIGAVKAMFRGTTPITLVKWALNKNIHVRLDSAHPTGASHHQKVVVIDDCFAFCGGIDMTSNRWDTRDHKDSDPLRVGPTGKPYMAWHDATMALSGPVAAALGELARERWACAGGEKLPVVEASGDCWPDTLEPDLRDCDVAISRTRPAYGDVAEAHEIETLYLAMIARAKRSIYAESQYFASRKIAEALSHRLAEPDGPEVVLINPAQADGWLEQEAMDTARARLVETLRRIDTNGRFRLYHPVTATGEPIYVHAKIMIVDGEMLRVGSSNWNNRSLRLDTECDVTIDSARPGNQAAGPVIRALRAGLMAEHLGVEPAEIARRIDGGSLIETIEALRGAGRTLVPYQIPDLSAVEEYLADHEVLDPEGPDEMFEALTHRSLFQRLRHPGKGTSGSAASLRSKTRKESDMSHIPSSAMPHAAPHETDTAAETASPTLGERASSLSKQATEQAGRLADLARENPKAAIAAGAAVVAGVAAAAAIPLVRAARRKSAAGTTAKPATAKAPARKRAPAKKSPTSRTPKKG
jgi:phosphatidylserine/phosphatidylglycerophosphate/cardiolipin synthase-like enzyme